MEKKMELLPPMMPNFITIERQQNPIQNEFNEFKLRVCELSNKEAEQYGELMKQAFIQHHKEHIKREAKQNKNLY